MAPFTATGFFHTAWRAGRWWLVTPDGQPFYSTGIDHVSASPDVDRTTGVCPYCVTVAKDYPSIAAWDQATVTRLEGWGFNTLGPWSDTALDSKMPYTVLLSMASGNDWFAPSFVTNAQAVAASQVAPLADDPNLIGWYTDSELSWGPGLQGSQSLLDQYLALPAGSPGRAVAETYVGNPSGFTYALATRYFSVTTAAIRAVDPHHLILGVKAIAQLIPPQVLEAARPYVDVFSVDDYAVLPVVTSYVTSHWPGYLPVEPDLANIEAIVGKPLIVAEYSFRAADSGVPNTWPPIYPTLATQGQRAARYAAFAQHLRAAPWMVGDDWFEYVDEPNGGRFDGENSNFGVVSVLDRPYAALVDRMTQADAVAPDRMAAPGGRCLLWARSPAGAVTCTNQVPASAIGPPGVPDGTGMWVAGPSGAVASSGNAPAYGSAAHLHLNEPIVGMAATPDGGGYWLVAADGGVFAFGDATFYGSAAHLHLNEPIVGMAASPDGGGYWLVAADGGVFAFGDATFSGSAAHLHLAAPVVGMATDPAGGYWLVAADGGVFAFGGAPFCGSGATAPATSPVVAIDGTAVGYRIVTSAGGERSFGPLPALSPAPAPAGGRVVGATS